MHGFWDVTRSFEGTKKPLVTAQILSWLLTACYSCGVLASLEHLLPVPLFLPQTAFMSFSSVCLSLSVPIHVFLLHAPTC